MARTFTYAVGAMLSDRDVLAIKVGITSGNPYHRMRALQTGSPLKLEMLGLKPFLRREKAAQLEAWLHRALAHHAMQGEWLRAVPIVEQMVRRSFDDQFMLNWYDFNCFQYGHVDCGCRAPEWRCA